MELRHARNANGRQLLGVGGEVLGERGQVEVGGGPEGGLQLADDRGHAAGAVALHVQGQDRVVQRQAQEAPAVAVLGVARNPHALCNPRCREAPPARVGLA